MYIPRVPSLPGAPNRLGETPDLDPNLLEIHEARRTVWYQRRYRLEELVGTYYVVHIYWILHWSFPRRSVVTMEHSLCEETNPVLKVTTSNCWGVMKKSCPPIPSVTSSVGQAKPAAGGQRLSRGSRRGITFTTRVFQQRSLGDCP